MYTCEVLKAMPGIYKHSKKKKSYYVKKIQEVWNILKMKETILIFYQIKT